MPHLVLRYSTYIERQRGDSDKTLKKIDLINKSKFF